MTVCEKLVQARMKFQNSSVKKSGYNKHANYAYFELSDILPVCNKICEELKVVCVVSFSDTTAFLNFIDCEKPEDKITFTSPMSEASVPGCSKVQNLGAVQTYIKRYLYQNCFEIAENDSLDGTMNPNETKQAQPPRQAQSKQNAPKNPPPQVWTKEQLTELGVILDSKYEDGTPVFNQADKDVYNALYQQCADFNTSLSQAKDTLRTRISSKQSNQQSNLDTF